MGYRSAVAVGQTPLDCGASTCAESEEPMYPVVRPFAVIAAAIAVLSASGVCASAATKKPPAPRCRTFRQRDHHPADHHHHPRRQRPPHHHHHPPASLLSRHRDRSFGRRPRLPRLHAAARRRSRPAELVHGPDVQGDGGYPLARPFYIPGIQSEHAVLRRAFQDSGASFASGNDEPCAAVAE